MHCAALTAAICIPVLADVPATSSGLVATSAILSATEHSGETDVTADLLAGNTATAWVRTSAAAPDLSLGLSGTSVGEIWIRSGYCYNQNYYNSYDRPATVAVTIWYAYGQQSVTYRYTLSDAFLPTTSSADWSNGYQRLLLPEEYTGLPPRRLARRQPRRSRRTLTQPRLPRQSLYSRPRALRRR